MGTTQSVHTLTSPTQPPFGCAVEAVALQTIVGVAGQMVGAAEAAVGVALPPPPPPLPPLSLHANGRITAARAFRERRTRACTGTLLAAQAAYTVVARALEPPPVDYFA
jgi:hypothetical protein